MNDTARERAAVLPPFVALWCAGGMLRLTVLAIPPLTPLLHGELGLTQSALAALTTLPVLLLAVGAPMGAAATARVGPRAALVAALVVIAFSSGLRGASGVGLLFALTLVMGLAIGAAQPTMPDLVQSWVPRSAHRATATWVNGMLVAEVAAASLTLPLLLPLAGGSWRVALAWWSVPVLATALLIALVRSREGAGTVVSERQRRRQWRPDWRSGTTWKLGLLQGGASVIYFGVNAFLASYLHATGRPGLVSEALTVLNATQVPATVMLALLPRSVVPSRALVACLGLFGLFGLVVMVAGPAPAVLAGAGITGFVAGAGITMAFTLPALFASREDVHRLSAGMMAIGYSLAFLLPLAGGMAWDLTGVPVLGFAPAFVSAAGLLVLAPTLRRAPRSGDEASGVEPNERARAGTGEL